MRTLIKKVICTLSDIYKNKLDLDLETSPFKYPGKENVQQQYTKVECKRERTVQKVADYDLSLKKILFTDLPYPCRNI